MAPKGPAQGFGIEVLYEQEKKVIALASALESALGLINALVQSHSVRPNPYESLINSWKKVLNRYGPRDPSEKDPNQN